MTTNKYYHLLMFFQHRYPKLTFNNNGYEYLSKEIVDSHKNQIELISKILKTTLSGFVKFNNFKPRKDGSFAVRVQTHYDETFVGVSYYGIELFKDFVIEEQKS